MTIFAIETSCDETAVAIIEDGCRIKHHLVASQIKWHREYGGVVPELASRMHAEKIHILVDKVLEESDLSLADIDAFAVTYGPGLEGALLVGISVAKTMAQLLGKPLVPVNHLQGHIYSAFLGESVPEFPFVTLIASGGHTLLVHVKGHFDFEVLGSTRDDACGEAFDKVARVLGLPYPGGPEIEKAALDGDMNAFDFPRAMIKEGLEFSFSGLKTAVIQTVRKYDADSIPVSDISASFQKCVMDILVQKSMRACQQTKASTLVICGGVMANNVISSGFKNAASKLGVSIFVPPLNLCTDNAAMIGATAYYRLECAPVSDYRFSVRPQLGVCDV